MSRGTRRRGPSIRRLAILGGYSGQATREGAIARQSTAPYCLFPIPDCLFPAVRFPRARVNPQKPLTTKSTKHTKDTKGISLGADLRSAPTTYPGSFLVLFVAFVVRAFSDAPLQDLFSIVYFSIAPSYRYSALSDDQLVSSTAEGSPQGHPTS